MSDALLNSLLAQVRSLTSLVRSHMATTETVLDTQINAQASLAGLITALSVQTDILTAILDQSSKIEELTLEVRMIRERFELTSEVLLDSGTEPTRNTAPPL